MPRRIFLFILTIFFCTQLLACSGRVARLDFEQSKISGKKQPQTVEKIAVVQYQTPVNWFNQPENVMEAWDKANIEGIVKKLSEMNIESKIFTISADEFESDKIAKLTELKKYQADALLTVKPVSASVMNQKRDGYIVSTSVNHVKFWIYFRYLNSKKFSWKNNFTYYPPIIPLFGARQEIIDQSFETFSSEIINQLVVNKLIMKK